MHKIMLANPILNGNERKYVLDCIDTGWLSANGKYVKEFEKKFAEFCGVKHAIACMNGTVALHLPLLAYDIQPGDEILVPTLTYIATANVVRYCGATPVFVDSEPETWNIDPIDIERKITKKTKGIIPVHLYGQPANMMAIMEIAKKHNLFVIEDAAEAHGALCNGQLVGSIGDIGVFSFFANKIIATGEGGMITTNDDILADKMRLLRGQGMDPKHRYWFPIIGYNYRMTNMQAAVGLGQLENIEWHLNERQRIAQGYFERCKGYEEYFYFQKQATWAKHVYWMMSIILTDKVQLGRDDFMQKMDEAGIETRPVFYPMHVMPPYKENKSYPISEQISARGFNIPTNATLTDTELNYICKNIIDICRGKY